MLLSLLPPPLFLNKCEGFAFGFALVPFDTSPICVPYIVTLCSTVYIHHSYIYQTNRLPSHPVEGAHSLLSLSSFIRQELILMRQQFDFSELS